LDVSRREGSPPRSRPTHVRCAEYRADLIHDLGGQEALSAAQLHIVDLAVRDRLLLDTLDAALTDRPLFNRKRKTVAPALEARFRMADSATRRLVALGLKRVKRRKSYNEIMAEICAVASNADAANADVSDDDGSK
jgi:hypothetical protein